METYDTNDIAVVNAIIDNNGLDWPKAPDDGSSVPDEWDPGVKWSDEESDRRITELHLSQKNLTGALNVSKLTELRRLACWSNELTALDVSKLARLADLNCSFNKLTALNLAELPALQHFTGKEQTGALVMTWNAKMKRYNAPIALSKVISLARGLRYREGQLMSSYDSVLSTGFAVDVGRVGKFISGELKLTYER